MDGTDFLTSANSVSADFQSVRKLINHIRSIHRNHVRGTFADVEITQHSYFILFLKVY